MPEDVGFTKRRQDPLEKYLSQSRRLWGAACFYGLEFSSDKFPARAPAEGEKPVLLGVHSSPRGRGPRTVAART